MTLTAPAQGRSRRRPRVGTTLTYLSLVVASLVVALTVMSVENTGRSGPSDMM